ncbi:MAG TPA: hypothetical protein VE573_13760 [Nitrososphaeraceae archaeon]|nr:hypothetical protein [Nitrososphaeraceae archaeon]
MLHAVSRGMNGSSGGSSGVILSRTKEAQCMIVLESHVLKVRSTKTYSVGPTAVKFLPSCKLGEHYQNDLKLVQTWCEYIILRSS